MIQKVIKNTVLDQFLNLQFYAESSFNFPYKIKLKPERSGDGGFIIPKLTMNIK